MRNFVIVVAAMLAVMYFFNSSSRPKAAQVPEATVGASETFTWQGEQPIAFKPPQGWTSQRSQQGGRNGVRYINSGQSIAVTEYARVGELDGCARLQEILGNLDVKNKKSLQRDLSMAVRNPRDVSKPTEARLIRGVAEYIGKAQKSLADGDFQAVRRQIDNALRTRATNRLKLDDYLADVIYSQAVRGDIKRVDIGLPKESRVGGERAVSVDYEIDIRAQYATGVLEKTEQGRELYLMSNNRLFVLSYQGKPENLPLFEKVVASVSFPDGSCSL